MKLSSSVLGLAGLATAEKFDPTTVRDNTQWHRSSEFAPGADAITLDCNGIASIYSDVNDVKWYRKAYYKAPNEFNAVVLDEEKFIEVKRNEDGVKEQMDLGNAAEINDYKLDNGQLIITPTGGFDQDLYAAAGLTLRFLCEADIKSADSSMLDEHDDQLYTLRFIDVPEEPVKEIIETVRSRQFVAGSSETMADCISGYSSRPLTIAWHAVNQKGEKTELPDGSAFIESSKLEDVDGHTENLQVSLQFPYKNGDMPLDGSYDRNFFECSVTYNDAVDGEEVTLTATKRYPEDDVIRVEHKMDAIDFTVNNILASGDSSIIVPKGETVDVVCQPNGFKIGEDHEITLLRDGDALDGVVVFSEEAELTCTAELDGEKVSKTVSVIPIDIGGVKATQDRFRPSDPWNIWVSLDGTGNVDFDKEDLTTTFYDKKGNVVDAKLIDNDGDKAEFQAESSQAVKVVVSVANSDIKEEAVVVHEPERGFRNKEDEFCRFKPYHDKGESPIKMWYSSCDDEESKLTPYTENWHVATDLENDDVAGRLEDNPNPGMYICCYDALDDVEQYLMEAVLAKGNVCQAELGSEPLEFKDKLVQCSSHYQVGMASFPWWIILVLLLIIVVVIAACWFWNKQKDKNENDLEANNVKEIHDGDGEITAEQEQQDPLLDVDQQQQQQQQQPTK